jgi:NitT/TauT family transport system ATP-binding protein
VGGALVRAEGLTTAYDGRLVFQGLDFQTPAGSSLALVGPSGCGKSTLMHLLAGLRLPEAGQLEISPPRAKSAVVLQDFGLFPWKNVRQNLELPLAVNGCPRRERAERVADMLAEMGLAGWEDHYPDQLSGGQKQRLALGRALIAEPDLLLLDEPFSSLDALTRENMQNFLAGLWRGRGLTLILATHFIEEAVFFGERILVLGGTPTRVAADIANPACGRPESRFEEKYFQTIKQVRRVLYDQGPGRPDAENPAPDGEGRK